QSALRRWTGLKRCPVNAELKFVVWRKNCLERECKLCRPVRLKVCQSFLGFIDARAMTCRHPPQGIIDRREFLEPLASLPQQFGMGGAIHIVLEGLHRFPYRHIEEHAIVI